MKWLSRVLEVGFYCATLMAAGTLIGVQIYLSQHDRRAAELAQPVTTAEIRAALDQHRQRSPQIQTVQLVEAEATAPEAQ